MRDIARNLTPSIELITSSVLAVVNSLFEFSITENAFSIAIQTSKQDNTGKVRLGQLLVLTIC